MISEIYRVLNQSGVYIIISYGQPEYRLSYLEKPEFEWINVSTSLLQYAEEGANGHILHFHGQKSIPRTL